jgi:hypothetical protein
MSETGAFCGGEKFALLIEIRQENKRDFALFCSFSISLSIAGLLSF